MVQIGFLHELVCSNKQTDDTQRRDTSSDRIASTDRLISVHLGSCDRDRRGLGVIGYRVSLVNYHLRSVIPGLSGRAEAYWFLSTADSTMIVAIACLPVFSFVPGLLYRNWR